MAIKYKGTFVSLGDGSGTWQSNDGQSGKFELTDYKLSSDKKSLTYKQKFFKSDGKAYAEVEGVLRGDLTKNSGKYSGEWSVSESKGKYSFQNFRQGKLISTGSFTPLGTSSPLSPNFTLTPSSQSVKEGQSVTTTITTSNNQKGKSLYYKIVGSNVNKSDFSLGNIQGTVKVGKNGSAKLTHKLKADKVPEGNESFRIQVFSDKGLKTLLGQSDAVTVLDSSVKSGENSSSKSSIVPSKRQLKEDESLTTTFKGFKQGTTLYYKVVGSNVNKSDFSSGNVLGTIKVGKNGTAKLNHKLRADKSTEGNESFRVQAFSDKGMKTPITQSDIVTIIDSSIKPLNKSRSTTSNSPAANNALPKTINFFGLGQVKSDTTYTSNKLDSISDPIITGFGVRRDAITGISYEFEWSKQYVIFTTKVTTDTKKYSNIDSSSTLRIALKGDFYIKNGDLAATRIDELGLVSYGTRASDKKSSHTWLAAKQPRASNPSNPFSWIPSIYNNSNEIASYSKLNGSVQFGDKEVNMQPFGNGKIFANSWQNNPFASDIV